MCRICSAVSGRVKRRSLRALETTETELIAIAAEARTGSSRSRSHPYRAPAATGMSRMLYPKAHPSPCLMVRTVRRDRAMAAVMPRRSPPTRVMSEAAMATSVPVPIAMPRSAVASAGASLMPSPTNPTTCPASRRAVTCAAFSAGSTSATTWSMPTAEAMACAVAVLSPVSIHTSSPSAFSWAMASAEVGFTVSATATRPARVPSTATYIGVCPLAARAAASSASGVVSTPTRSISLAFPTATASVADEGGDAVARDRVEVDGRCQLEAGVAGGSDDGFGDRVLAADLGGGDQGQELVGVPAVVRDDGCDGRAAVGDGAGLVEDDGGEPVRGLERFAVADEDAELGGAAGADHDGGRGGQAECAGAGDDQDGDGGADGQGHVGGVGAEEGPAGEGAGRDEEHDGHEDGRDLVGQCLHRDLRGLGVLDQGDDLGERGVRADGGRLEDEGAGAVQGGADDRVPGLLGHRGALAGQHRLIDGRGAFDDDAVDGDLLSGADPDVVAGDGPGRGRRRPRCRRGRRGRSWVPGRRVP